MRSFFITGTDTGVGKTVIAGLLAGFLLQKRIGVVTQKWIQTGAASLRYSDINSHFKIMGVPKKKYARFLKDMLPYNFKTACSPHLAAAIEKKKINVKNIIRSYNNLARSFDIVIAEGVGGALVPMDNKRLVIDIARQLDIPAIIVSGNKLGSINHTLLAIEALRARDIKIAGIIFNDLKSQKRFILDDNPRIIRSFTKENILGALPYERDMVFLRKRFAPIGERILKLL